MVINSNRSKSSGVHRCKLNGPKTSKVHRNRRVRNAGRRALGRHLSLVWDGPEPPKDPANAMPVLRAA